MLHWIRSKLAALSARRAAGRAAKAALLEKRHRARAASRRSREKKMAMVLEQIWTATDGDFVIADLETTGLSAKDEILEFAAIIARANGEIAAEFSTLVRVRRPVPALITNLTGITQAQVNRHGIPLTQALPQFLEFIGNRPVFFHNAGFDRRFIRDAAARLGLPFDNPVHCTLSMARAMWPQLPSHKLAILARHVGASAPTHRGLDDVKSTLEVLLAAKEQAESIAA
jgi:DNA polymerase-3 subunit epsilon